MFVVAGAVLVAVAAIVVITVVLRATDVSKNYVQTWAKSYATTTCAEWNTTMTDKQKFATAGDFLWDDLSRNGAKDRPGFGPISNYQDAIDSECRTHESSTLATVGDDLGPTD